MKSSTLKILVPQVVFTAIANGEQVVPNGTAYSPALSKTDIEQIAKFLEAAISFSEVKYHQTDPYYSFLKISEDKYMFSQRFTDKYKNQDRIVVHILVLYKELLQSVQWDLIDIINGCQFQQGHDYTALYNMDELRKQIDGKEITNISNLYCARLTNPLETATETLLQYQMLVRIKNWSYKRLHTFILGAITALIAYKQSIALPRPPNTQKAIADKTYEYLLWLIWSILPPKDRAEISWSTFPWNNIECRIANYPDTPAYKSIIAKDLNKIPQLATKATASLYQLVDAIIPEDIALLQDQNFFKRIIFMRNGLFNYELTLNQPIYLQAWLNFSTNGTESMFTALAQKGCASLEELTEIMPILQRAGLNLDPIPPWLAQDIHQIISLTALNIISECGNDLLTTELKIKNLYKTMGFASPQNLNSNLIESLKTVSDASKLQEIAPLLAIELVSDKKHIYSYPQIFTILDIKINSQYDHPLRQKYPALMALIQKELAFTLLTDAANNKEFVKRAEHWLLEDVIKKCPDILSGLVSRIAFINPTPNLILLILWNEAIERGNTKLTQELFTNIVVKTINDKPKYASYFDPHLVNELLYCPWPLLLTCLNWPKPAVEYARKALRKRLSDPETYPIAAPNIVAPEELCGYVISAFQEEPKSLNSWSQAVINLFEHWLENSSDVQWLDNYAHVATAGKLAIAWWKNLARIKINAKEAKSVAIKLINHIHSQPQFETEWRKDWQSIAECWQNSITNNAVRSQQIALVYNLLRLTQTLDLLPRHGLWMHYINLRIRDNPDQLLQILSYWDLNYKIWRDNTENSDRLLQLETLLTEAKIAPKRLLDLLCSPMPITLYNLLMNKYAVAWYGDDIVNELLAASNSHNLPATVPLKLLIALAYHVNIKQPLSLNAFVGAIKEHPYASIILSKMPTNILERKTFTPQ
ncbi:hypothetical protein TI04_07255 [Achromatium sp. WMS2]|nr:hypothetical protein TI04_07255 [Achromatium sp. WMS2]